MNAELFLHVLSVKGVTGRLSHNQLERLSNFRKKLKCLLLVANLVASIIISINEEDIPPNFKKLFCLMDEELLKPGLYF